MAVAKRRDAWDHTSQMLALIINVNRDPKKSQPMSAEKLHPFRDDFEPLSIEQQNAMLKEQCATIRARHFGDRVTYIKPFTPANAKNGQAELN